MEKLPIMSVSGIRGVVATTFTPLLVTRIAFIQTRIARGGVIAVARDTRPSGSVLARAAFRGIRAAGGTPLDLGIAPTPTACVAVPALNAAGGIILTASHNPAEYNGLKMIHPSGRLFNADECEAVYASFRSGAYPPSEELQKFTDVPQAKADAGAIHINRICSHINTRLTRSRSMTIAVDAINGAAAAVFPALLEALGVKWMGVNTGLDGSFTHNPEPRPEHLGGLSDLCRKHADLWAGFAFDPDGDRLATMEENGGAISEEMTLVFCLQHMLQRMKSDIAVNLSTSMLVDDVATRFGVNVFRTRIGEANVVEGMLRHNCRLGGEGNGGFIFPAVSTARDGLMAMAVVIELMAHTGKKLSALASEWPRYAIVKEKIAIGAADPGAVMERLAVRFSEESVDRLEGLKIIRDGSWVHVRPSNTEPIIRCYAEARTRKEAEELAGTVMKELAALI